MNDAMNEPDAELEEIRRRVEAILEADRTDDDPEEAHGEQDGLYVAVLKAVANNHPHHIDMAQAALRIHKESKGTRWYA